jgi:hypothetical protein
MYLQENFTKLNEVGVYDSVMDDNYVRFLPSSSPDAIPGTTTFGRNKVIHQDLIRHFLKLKNSGAQAPEGGYRIFFPAASVLCEAYYFAMLAKKEHLLEDGFLKIHATDKESAFVEYGIKGIYPPEILHYLKPELREEFFNTIKQGRQTMVALSEEIKNHVIIEPPGDIRQNIDKQKYDAVVLTHILYHLKNKTQKEVLQTAMRMSRGIVVTDYTSFDEKRRLYNNVMKEMGYTIGDKNFAATDINIPINLSYRFARWSHMQPITALAEQKSGNLFYFLKLNTEKKSSNIIFFNREQNFLPPASQMKFDH